MIAALHWLKKREPIKDSQSNSKGYHFNVLGDIEVLTPVSYTHLRAHET